MAEETKNVTATPKEEEPGKLTDQEVDQAIAWFTEKMGPHRPCPMCGTAHWSVGQHVRIPLREPNALIVTHYPVIALICNNCSYTAFFNAVFMGVVEPPDEEG